jgi:pyruvate,water dikinase
MPAKPLVLFFNQFDKDDAPLVGGKGANLGEMTKAGLPVPNGFAITVYSYDNFLEENNLSDKIYSQLKSIDVSNPDELESVAANIRRSIKSSRVPQEVVNEVKKAYSKLSGVFKSSLVAVRSSATAEDLPGTSFAGQQITFLNVKGDANLIAALKDCWASLFTPRSIFYRVQNKIPHDTVKISVIVQKMVQSQVSGVIFTVDPVTNEKDRIVIEAVWGLGELIVQGSVMPDRYIVQKETFDILSKSISEQHIELIKVKNSTKEARVPKNRLGKQKISDKDIVTLAKIADGLQKHYYFPQDIEWAKEKNKIFIVQTRPVTTINQGVSEPEQKSVKNSSNLSIILSGIPASPGIATGKVKIVKTPKGIGRVKQGDVLVSVMTSPDFVPAMKKASAIVTDEGGMTSHAAIVSRELGLPCVVGAKQATKKLVEGQLVTVDGSDGNVYLGSEIKIQIPKNLQIITSNKKTATKLYVNLAEPQRANEIARLNVDGIGLLRAEFIMANIGIHPKEAIRRKKQEDYVSKLAQGIKTFCKAFYPRPVVYRASDFKTNEYHSLEGGRYWEPVESNPLLGFRGAFRYISNPEVFTLELKALKEVLQDYNNLHLMIPFVRSVHELGAVKKIVGSEDLFKFTNFKFLMMVELPVNIILLKDFIEVGIDGVSIGSNDLTMLLTGTDRDNSDVAQVFDENSPAVLWAIKKTIKTCNKYNITSSICGQAPSTREGFADNLVKWAITSISVNPDSIGRVRETIARAEKELAKGLTNSTSRPKRF